MVKIWTQLNRFPPQHMQTSSPKRKKALCECWTISACLRREVCRTHKGIRTPHQCTTRDGRWGYTPQWESSTHSTTLVCTWCMTYVHRWICGCCISKMWIHMLDSTLWFISSTLCGWVIRKLFAFPFEGSGTRQYMSTWHWTPAVQNNVSLPISWRKGSKGSGHSSIWLCGQLHLTRSMTTVYITG